MALVRPDAFMPDGFDCTQVDGWGDFRMAYTGMEIAFSAEDVGWIVTGRG